MSSISYSYIRYSVIAITGIAITDVGARFALAALLAGVASAARKIFCISPIFWLLISDYKVIL